MTRVRSLLGESYERTVGPYKVEEKMSPVSYILHAEGTNGLRAFTSIACVDG
jgi:hypothetical protein